MSKPPPLPGDLEKPGSPPSLGATHAVRISALEPEYTWRLDGSILWMCTEGQADIPLHLSNVTTVRLSFDPTRMQRQRYRCRLYSAHGLCATIQNDSYLSFGSFDNRSKSYNSLMHLLIPRIASLSPHCIFKSGTSYLSWWAQALMIVVIFSILIFLLVALYTVIGPLVIIKLIVIAFFIPTLFRWFLKNKPRTFNPTEIPKNLLP